MGRLLIVACSQRKSPMAGKIPAIERYDGPVFRVLRKYLAKDPRDAPIVLILSAKFGLIEASRRIPNYDLRLSPASAPRLRQSVIKRTRLALCSAQWDHFGVCAGKDYWAFLDGLENLAPDGLCVDRIGGGQGKRLTNLRKWLLDTEWADVCPTISYSRSRLR